MVTVPLTSFVDSHGNTLRLGKRIGSGGEGDVYQTPVCTGHHGGQDLPQAARGRTSRRSCG